MSFSAALAEVVDTAQADIRAIGAFASEAERMLEDKQTAKPTNHLRQMK